MNCCTSCPCGFPVFFSWWVLLLTVSLVEVWVRISYGCSCAGASSVQEWDGCSRDKICAYCCVYSSLNLLFNPLHRQTARQIQLKGLEHFWSLWGPVTPGIMSHLWQCLSKWTCFSAVCHSVPCSFSLGYFIQQFQTCLSIPAYLSFTGQVFLCLQLTCESKDDTE